MLILAQIAHAKSNNTFKALLTAEFQTFPGRNHMLTSGSVKADRLFDFKGQGGKELCGRMVMYRSIGQCSSVKLFLTLFLGSIEILSPRPPPPLPPPSSSTVNSGMC